MQFIHPNSHQLTQTPYSICQGARHPITNRVHSTSPCERIKEARRETNRDHLGRLVRVHKRAQVTRSQQYSTQHRPVLSRDSNRCINQ